MIEVSQDYQRVGNKGQLYALSLALLGVVAVSVALFQTNSSEAQQIQNETLVLAQSAECPAFTDLEWKGIKMGLRVLDQDKDSKFTISELTSYIKV